MAKPLLKTRHPKNTRRRERSAAAVIAAAALLLGACAPNEPPEVTRGWADGCSSGYHDGHGPEYGGVYMKEREQYDSDAKYRQAWDDAYQRCYAMPYPMMRGGF